MSSSMWFLRIVALLVIDVRTGALQDRDIPPNLCHSCNPGNGTECTDLEAWPSIKCPSDRPVCATIATAPGFTSTLTCVAPLKTPCLLHNQSNNIYELICTCSGHNCNTPFSLELRNKLLNFTFLGNTSDLTSAFFKYSKFSNITENNLYKELTVTNKSVHPSTTTEVSEIKTKPATKPMTTILEDNTIVKDAEQPKAEALKQEVTAPSDDDEDENEGSGNYEETKPKQNGYSASAPAAPSSYLPADSHAAPLCINLSTFLILIFSIV